MGLNFHEFLGKYGSSIRKLFSVFRGKSAKSVKIFVLLDLNDEKFRGYGIRVSRNADQEWVADGFEVLDRARIQDNFTGSGSVAESSGDLHLTTLSRQEIFDSISVLNGLISTYICSNGLKERWDLFLSAHEAGEYSKLTAVELEDHVDFGMQAISGYAYHAHFCAPLIVRFFLDEALDAVDVGDLRRANYCVARAQWWGSPEMLMPRPADRFRERSAMGNAVKSKKYDSVKLLVKKYFEERSSCEWSSSRSAAVSVADYLNESSLHEVEKVGLLPDNLQETIKAWIDRSPEEFRIKIKLGGRH